MTASPPRDARTRVRRLPDRAAYDAATIAAILDAGMVAHVGFVVDGQPYVIPTLHARVGDAVYIHGSTASRAMRALAVRRARVPDRHPPRRARARPIRVPSLGQLPVGGRAGEGGRG